jgi:hypothetical protein
MPSHRKPILRPRCEGSGEVPVAIGALCPLLQVFDMPRSLRFWGLFMACEDLEGAYAHLVSHGVKAQPPKVAPYGMKQLYATDPDGYELCFQWPVSQRSGTANPSVRDGASQRLGRL